MTIYGFGVCAYGFCRVTLLRDVVSVGCEDEGFQFLGDSSLL